MTCMKHHNMMLITVVFAMWTLNGNAYRLFWMVWTFYRAEFHDCGEIWLWKI